MAKFDYKKGDYLIGADYPAVHVGGRTPPPRPSPPRLTPSPVRYGAPAPDFEPIAEKLDTIAAQLDALAQRVRSARART